MRRIAIDCEPLRLRRVWVLIGSLTERTEPACTSHVVFPNWLANYFRNDCR
jgi:hypothetical protein